MNYLGHLILAGNHPMVQIGSFIADSVKGKSFQQLDENIRKGIILHRKIDSYTDQHPIFQRTRRILNPSAGHYSAVLVDMMYDHFLAANWKRFHSMELNAFSIGFYQLLYENFGILPQRIQHIIPYMISDNWFVAYASVGGLSFILKQMDKRTMFKSNFAKSLSLIENRYQEFESDFFEFFQDVQNFVVSI